MGVKDTIERWKRQWRYRQQRKEFSRVTREARQMRRSVNKTLDAKHVRTAAEPKRPDKPVI